MKAKQMKIGTTMIFFLLAFAWQQGKAQDKLKDSLLEAIKTVKEDTNRVISLNALAFIEVRSGNGEQAKKYADQALQLATKLGFKKGIASAHVNTGGAYNTMSQISAATGEFMEGYRLRQELGDKKGMAFCRNALGNIYNNQGKFPEALKEFYASLKLQEEIGNKDGIARAHIGIGNVHYYQNEYDAAAKEYETALVIKKQVGNKMDIAGVTNNIGVVYERGGKLKEALEKYFEALKVREEIGDSQGIADSRVSIANVYSVQKKFKEAMEQYELVLAIQQKIGDKAGLALTYFNLGATHVRMKEYKKAKEEYALSLQMSKELDDKNQVVQNYSNMAYLDSATGNFRDAFANHKNYMAYRDSIFNEDNTKKMTQTEMQYEFDKKETLAKAEQEKKDALAAEEKNRQRIITTFIAIGLVFAIVFIVVVIRSLRITKKQKNIIEQQKDEVVMQKTLVESQKHIIEEKHKEITDSINYAERIQRSFLASTELLDQNLHDYFVFFQPKDVVSGDFYWAAELSNGDFAYATADSTGHGVPGAIMSILNISSLEKAVERETEPSHILSETRKHIIDRLKKDGSAEGGKDGMDCSLVVLNKKQSQLKYAAANNPVWIVRGDQLLELAADKMPVGKHDKDAIPFSEATVDLQPGDVVYTLTDGMPDQFGGPKGKKFMYKKLKQLLVSIAPLPMKTQHERLSKELKDWKGSLEQVDDVCIIGVRV